MRMKSGRSLVSIVILFAIASGLHLPAQESPARLTQMEKTADPGWEVTTVKPSDPSDTRGQHINMSGQDIKLLDTTVEEFLLIGYSVQKVQLVNLPDWARTQRWDVEGKPDTAGVPDLRQLQSMMRKLLAERFGLTLHHEQRELPVYVLSLGKGAPKVIPNNSNPNGWMEQRNGENHGVRTENLKNASMQELCLILQFHIDRPVVDHTDLKGRYDFQLKWQTDDNRVADSADPNPVPGLFTAIQEQLGLKLVPMKAPADVLVIDKVERAGAN